MEEVNTGILRPTSGSGARDKVNSPSTASKRRVSFSDNPASQDDEDASPVNQFYQGCVASMGNYWQPTEPSIKQKYGINDE